MRMLLSFGLVVIAFVSAAGDELDPAAIEAVFAQGVDAYDNEEDYGKALELMNTVLEANPDHDGALYYRAKLYIRKEKLAEATVDIDRALELKPDEQRYIYTKGRTFHYQDQPQKAIEWYTKALDQGFYSLALHKRIRLYIEAGEYQKALDDCSWLYKHEPTPETKMLRAEALIGLGELDKALAVCDDVLRDKDDKDKTSTEKKKTAANCMVRAEVHLKLGNIEKAYYDLVSASYLEKEKPEPILALGDFFLFHKPDFRQAIAYYTAVIEHDAFKRPKSEPEKKRHELPIARLRRGQAYLALDAANFGKNALDDFDRYIELQPADPEGYAERAKLRHAMGERDKALADVHKAIELDPDNEQYTRMLEAITAGSAEAPDPGGNTDTEPPDSEEE